MHHAIWNASEERARRKQALILFLPPDVIWADGAMASLARRIDEGKRVLFSTYLRVSSERIADELEPAFRGPDGSLVVPPRAMVAAGFRHLHPLTSCYLADSPHFPHHPEMVIFGIQGEGLLVRVLARELFCFDPNRFQRNHQTLLATLPQPHEVHLFDDSDELCSLSLTPLFKDHTWYSARNRLDPVSTALWWLDYDSPVNAFLWRQPVRYHTGVRSEESWARAERESESAIARIEAIRELLRLHRALRGVGLAAFSRCLARAALQGDLAAHWDVMQPATLLAPTDRALAPLDDELHDASPDRLVRFVLAHRLEGHLDLPAPWRPRDRSTSHPASPGDDLARHGVSGHGFAVGTLDVYPTQDARALPPAT
jgi:hypothetical protein